MDEEALQVRYLIVIAAVLCALIIGYNAFYVPDASVDSITVTADVSSAVNEEYTPSAVSPSGAAASAVSSGHEQTSAVQAAQSEKININTATAQQLSDGLDGVGTVMAKRIVEYREKNGNFKAIEELKKVQGIGDKTFEKLKEHIMI